MLINYNTKALRPSLKVVHHLFESDFTEVNFEKAEYDQRLGRLKCTLFASIVWSILLILGRGWCTSMCSVGCWRNLKYDTYLQYKSISTKRQLLHTGLLWENTFFFFFHLRQHISHVYNVFKMTKSICFILEAST